MKNAPGHAYQFDAENRMVSFDGGTAATYTYDGEGHRVKKVTGNRRQTRAEEGE